MTRFPPQARIKAHDWVREVERSSEVKNVTDELKEENSAPEKEEREEEMKEKGGEGEKEEDEKAEESNTKDGKSDAVEVRWSFLFKIIHLHYLL